MHSKSALRLACVTACTVLAGSPTMSAAAALSVTLRGANGAPVAGAVVIAEPAAGAPRAHGPLKAVMDQRELRYVPDVLIVQTGTLVEFPNSDNVRHQVYSFSPAKTFQLALYSGHQHAAVLFDHQGLVTLGCNIHDSMLGYIYVTDSPWFGRTGADGTLQLHDLAAGDYTVRIWHPLLTPGEPQLQLQQHLDDNGSAAASFRLSRALRPDPLNNGTDKKWSDY
jgi:plastocyanin